MLLSTTSPATTGPAFHCLPPLTSPIELECSVPHRQARNPPTRRQLGDGPPFESAQTKPPQKAEHLQAPLHRAPFYTLQQFLAVSFAIFVQ